MGTRASLFVIVLIGGALLFAVEERARLSGYDSDKGLYGSGTNQNDARAEGYPGDKWSDNSHDPCQDAAYGSFDDGDEWEWQSDQELKQAVECQLAMSPFIKSDGIDVSVNDGTATLKGNVRDWDSVRNAIDDAYLAGVKDVVNELVVVDRV